MNVLAQLALQRSAARRSADPAGQRPEGQTVEQVSGPYVRLQGRWVLSFASANYLGLGRQPAIARAVSRAAQTWGVSLGMPRSLAADRLSLRLEAELARLVGQERALLFSSTTHAALDLLPLLAGPRGALLVDAQAYPISLEGAQAAAWRGARLLRFPHNDYRALARQLEKCAGAAGKVVVCDGVYPGDGRPAALAQIDRLARRHAAAIYVDDAHGLGVLGCGPTPSRPYGSGGGGTPSHLAIPPGRVVHVGSLSKAFGVPLAFAAGPAGFIDSLRATSPAQVHSSPPALPMVAAALAALQLNRVYGDRLRQRLTSLVRHFRDLAAGAGLALGDAHLFPLQTIPLASARAAQRAGARLLRQGVWAVVQRETARRPGGGLLFVLTARHTPRDIELAVAALSAAVSNPEDRVPPRP